MGLKLARRDILGATVAAILIAIGITVGAWIGTPARQYPNVKRIAMSAIVTYSLILICAMTSLILNR
jgi:hypothetical protein